MPIASGSRHGLRYAAETDIGVTPAPLTMTALRHTASSLVLSKENIVSEELRPDRQISDMRMVGNKVGGDIEFELSYGAYDDFLEALFMGEWDNDVLKAGVAMRSFTIERAFTDIGQYQVFTGCHVNEMNLSIKPNAIVTGSFALVGKGSRLLTTPLDAEPAPSPAHPPMDAVSGALKEGGLTVGYVTGVDLTFSNGIDPKYILGSLDAGAFIPGKSNVTGKISVFFEGPDMMRKFLDEELSSLEISLGNGLSGSYRLLLPRIRYSGSDNAVKGDDAILLDMPFQAILDPVSGTNIQLTRIP